jgi:hypothetical protein
VSVFPQVPRVVTVGLFVGGQWTDITGDVYTRDAITITRGAQNEQGHTPPARATLTLNNRSGNYSPRNPAGIYYGTLGRNTPLRITLQLASDTFTRTASSSWGTSDTGQTYTLSGAGGSVLAANLNVAAGLGTISVGAANAYRTVTISGVSLQDVDASVQVKLALASILGNAVTTSIIIRDQGGNNYIYARMFFNVGGSVTIGIVDNNTATFIAPDTVVPALAYSSSQTFSMRVQADGDTIRAKVWATSAGEPYAWTVTGHSTTAAAAGAVSVQAWVQSGNTNTLPIVFSMDNLTVGAPRFTGEASTWPQRWDITGNDVYTPIQADGIKRRLSQGAQPLKSALYRHHIQLSTPPVAYWPGEDPPNSAQQIATAIGPYSMIPDGLLDLAKYSGILASAPLFQIGGGLFYQPAGTTTHVPIGSFTGGSVTSYPSGTTTIRTLHFIPSSTVDETQFSPFSASIQFVSCTGTCGVFTISYEAGGSIRIQVGSGVPFYDSGSIAYDDVRGAPQLLQLQLTDSGGNTTWDLAQHIVGSASGLHFGTTLVGKTVGNVYNVAVDASRLLVGCAFGHISVRPEIVGFSDISKPLNGYSGETAGARVQRLLAEENITFSYRGDLTTTTLMGPQGAGSSSSSGSSNVSLTNSSGNQTLLDLLNECEDADTGTLYEPRGDIGLAYRTRSDSYSQATRLNLDYAAKQVVPPLEPIDDDQLTRNNVIVTRINALSAEAELTTGRMSTLDPSLGGVGRYDTQYTLNLATDDQLPDLATWLLTLGTVDEARYPTITANLANPDFIAAGLESAALAVDIGDRITISNPKTGQAPDLISQLVRGYTEVINLYEHTLTFNCRPETPYRIAQIGSSPQFKVDSDTSTLVSGITSTATSMSVANINQPWTTAAGQMPIQIMVAGEQLSVTAISGTSTPQTFTVTRSVNGIVKAQLAGAAVQLVRPSRPIIGL